MRLASLLSLTSGMTVISIERERVQYSTLQYSMAQYCTVQHSAIQDVPDLFGYVDILNSSLTNYEEITLCARHTWLSRSRNSRSLLGIGVFLPFMLVLVPNWYLEFVIFKYWC